MVSTMRLRAKQRTSVSRWAAAAMRLFANRGDYAAGMRHSLMGVADALPFRARRCAI
ncbi:hypothetical protein KCP71_24980 [Salmonella enterica subsp. enterica]|nr:hypothetical protein KCP71_24980 [Salmonella enterica subsp. enterica]